MSPPPLSALVPRYVVYPPRQQTHTVSPPVPPRERPLAPRRCSPPVSPLSGQVNPLEVLVYSRRCTVYAAV